MKALLYRRFEFLLKPVPIIGIVLFLLTSIFAPYIISLKEKPRVGEFFGTFGYDIAFALFFMVHYGIMLVFFLWMSLSVMRKNDYSKWSMFLGTTPVKKRTYVTEIYIFAFVSLFLLSRISSISFIGDMLILERFEIKNYILDLSYLGIALSILLSTLLPISLYFGSRKRYMALTLIILILTVFCGFIIVTVGINHNLFSSLDPLVKAGMAFIFSYGLLFISWFISQWIYKNREF